MLKLWPKIEIQDGGRPPSWNCCITVQDHPRSLFIGPHQPVKIYANPMHSFEDMAILICLQIWLKMPIYGPKISVFWGSEPLNVIDHHRDPKRHILGQNRAYLPIMLHIGPLVRPLHDMKELKKKERQGKKLRVAN